MGPLRKKGRGASGEKMEVLAAREELFGISTQIYNKLIIASKFGLFVQANNQKKIEPTSFKNGVVAKYRTRCSIFLKPVSFCACIISFFHIYSFYVQVAFWNTHICHGWSQIPQQGWNPQVLYNLTYSFVMGHCQVPPSPPKGPKGHKTIPN